MLAMMEVMGQHVRTLPGIRSHCQNKCPAFQRSQGVPEINYMGISIIQSNDYSSKQPVGVGVSHGCRIQESLRGVEFKFVSTKCKGIA